MPHSRPLLAVVLTLVCTTPFTAVQSDPPPNPTHVVFSTFLGGSGTEALQGLAVDPAGRVHVVGNTCSQDFPVTANALRPAPQGCEGFLAILSPAGALLYATYLGGSGYDTAMAIELDAAGVIHIVGNTISPDLPTTDGAYDRLCGSDGQCRVLKYGSWRTTWDVYVMKLAPLGTSLLYSTFVGGSDLDMAQDMALEPDGTVHIVGHTESEDFPATPGALSQSLSTDPRFLPEPDAFYARLGADGSSLTYATYVGGTRREWGYGVAVDADTGAAYAVGGTESRDMTTVNAAQPSADGSNEGWIVKISRGGTAEYATYIGGNSRDELTDVAVRDGTVYVTGVECSSNFPAEPPSAPTSCGGLLAKLTATGSAVRTVNLAWMRFPTLVIDQHHRAYYTATSGLGFEPTADAVQPTSSREAAVLGIVPMADGTTGEHTYATFYGGSGSDWPYALAVTPSGDAYLGGVSYSSEFPLVNPADGVRESQGSEGFLVRLSTEGIARNDVAGEVVLYAEDATAASGDWSLETDPAAAGGKRLVNRDLAAAKITEPLASPQHYVEFMFTAEAGTPYRLWIRGRAEDDHWANDSVHAQFSGSVDAAGTPVWRIGTASGTSVNLEDCASCGLRGWGWQDNGYGAGVLGPLVRFATTGTQTIRIQVREDGFSFDQVVLSSDRFLSASPGGLKDDGRVLARSNGAEGTLPPPPPPPGGCTTGEIVIHPGHTGSVAGAWRVVEDTTAASGAAVADRDTGAPKLTVPLAAPADYVEATFDADAGVAYRIWMRGKAERDYWGNDSVYAQFDGSVDGAGAAIWRIGTTSGTPLILEDCTACGLAGWGWQDNGYGRDVLGPVVRFAASGPQTVRLQTREDGITIDQIVLSAEKYLWSAPGAQKNDATILPACGGGQEPPPPPPSGTREIVLYPAADASVVGGRWERLAGTSATGGSVIYPDRGDAKITAPLATTGEVLEVRFNVEAGVAYHLWLRGRAQDDYWGNDSVWVQFSGSTDASGAPRYRIGTTDGAAVNLEDCVSCGVSGWGWQDNGYGAGVLGPAIYFATTGEQTIRLQPREDGLEIDQIVLSSERYLNSAPGALKDDTTIVAR